MVNFFIILFLHSVFSILFSRENDLKKKKKIIPVVERWREIGFFVFKSFSVLDYNSYGVE